jgi:hypothetical protein
MVDIWIGDGEEYSSESKFHNVDCDWEIQYNADGFAMRAIVDHPLIGLKMIITSGCKEHKKLKKLLGVWKKSSGSKNAKLPSPADLAVDIEEFLDAQMIENLDMGTLSSIVYRIKEDSYEKGKQDSRRALRQALGIDKEKED